MGGSVFGIGDGTGSWIEPAEIHFIGTIVSGAGLLDPFI